MDWSTVHAYAVEAEIWTTLLVNSWLIVGAISFFVLSPGKAKQALSTQLFGAVLWASIVIIAVLMFVPAVLTVAMAYELIQLQAPPRDVSSFWGHVATLAFFSLLVLGAGATAIRRMLR